MNGVIRGGQVKSTTVWYFRCGCRLGTYMRSVDRDWLGFRLNGVIRGVGRSDNGGRMRCSWRFARLSDNPSATFGFRLNGASRGGYYGASTADRQRCARRNEWNTRTYVHGGLGFRAV